MKKAAKRFVKKTFPRITAERNRLIRIEDQLTALVQENKALKAEVRNRDTRLDRLRAAVEKVEPYQPLYGVAGLVKTPARGSKDRAVCIQNCLGEVRGKRILDAGSSLGYMCFYFADRGAITEGWEYNPKNVEVSNLTKQINGIQTNFLAKELDPESVDSLEPGKFDAVIVLSVFHHITYYHGLAYSQKLVKAIFEKAPLMIVELARKGEDKKLFWDAAQPANELDIFKLVEDDVDIKKIGDFGNHLSENRRPMYAVQRKKVVTIGTRVYAYDSSTSQAYENSPVVQGKAHRRYYFADDYIIKEYIFYDVSRKEEWRQIVNELNVLNNLLLDKNIHHLPVISDYELEENHAKVVLTRIEGKLLGEAQITVATAKKVLKDVLHTLADLRNQNLYHNDVRSWNIIVNTSGGWLIDYGLASPVSTDDDLIALFWAIHAGMSGQRESYKVGKTDLPPKDIFKGDPVLSEVYDRVKSGRQGPGTLLKLFEQKKTSS